MRFTALILSGAGVLAAAMPASAQLTIQQPVFQNLSAVTAVSVPDRGSAFLGGVDRAASGRSSFGPPRSGSSIGLSREASGMSVGVFIHDFAEMDRQILGQASVRDSSAGLQGKAAHAWRSLAGRSASRTDPLPSSPTDLAGTARMPRERPEERSAMFLDLGRKAEARGAVNVARMHYRLAVKHGSAEAAKRIERLAEGEIVRRD